MSECGPFADGYNFMTENDDLAVEFTCTAQIGTCGDGIERPMEALVNTVEKINGDPGECNEGFIRDDALLVAVIITDEWDGPGDLEGAGSLGDPQSWYDDIVAAKGGIPENVVVVSVVNTVEAACSFNDDGVNIVEFTHMFNKNGFVIGICEPDYGPSFQEAIAVVDQACENYIPPG
jgi:hypothetical protein